MAKNATTQSVPHRLLAELKVRHLANIFIAVSVLVVLGMTLYPFDFTTEDFQRRWAPFISPKVESFRSEKEDVVTNFFLFLPIGVSFAVVAGRRRMAFVRSFATVTCAAGMLSLAIEALQLFLPFRYASFIDVASNTAGAAGGFLLFRIASSPVYRMLTRAVEKGNEGYASGWLVAAYALYLLGVLVITSPLQQSSFANEFNKFSYPLVIGNEPTGDRPWSGVVHNLIMTRHALSAEGVARYLADTPLEGEDARMVVMHYVFDGPGPYHDRARLHAPLEWNGAQADSTIPKEARVTPQRWLQTPKPAYEVSSWIMETHRFTICFAAASNPEFHHDNGRVISVSPNPYLRNFSIVQVGNDLGFRYRSMTTGVNGSNPQFVVPDVFADTLVHRVVVSLSVTSLDVYVDSVARHYHVELGPGFALLNRTFPFRGMLDISSPMKNFHNYLYQVVAFLPLAYLLGLLLTQEHMPRIARLVIAVVGIVCPPYLVEYELQVMTGRPILFEHVSPAMVVMAGTVVLTWVYYSLKPELTKRTKV